ncbi:MAG: 3-deoxy-D-manno-octulosonate 8-phosphate phosphatase [Bergeyella sp.]|nr:3-deoxy-D-manno-octulosonate 8-phosphate phosphatase [Bergeyella sp.]
MNYLEKLKDITTFIFDIDGVFTDGSLYLMPSGDMCRAMNVLDGYAVVKALRNGYRVGIITGGDDPMVRRRIRYLGIEDYYAKSYDKKKDYEHFKAKYFLKDEEILAMGDDLPDRPVLEACHIATCPENAVDEIKKVSEYISSKKGGAGAVRDVIERVMMVQGTWDGNDRVRSV